MTIFHVSEYLARMETGLFDKCEEDIREIPSWIEGDDFITEVADIERRAILETRLAISAIREFPRDLAERSEIVIREFSLAMDSKEAIESSMTREPGRSQGSPANILKRNADRSSLISSAASSKNSPAVTS